MNGRRFISVVGIFLAVLIRLASQDSLAAQAQNAAPQQNATPGVAFTVDPLWPKPLPAVKDSAGVLHQWITGEVGATCIDSHDHIFTVNRGFQKGGLTAQDGTTSIPAPPVVVYNPEGDVVATWGDSRIGPDGGLAVMPNGIHGCFADYQDNIWIAGNHDGIVQKYTHDGRLLLQIGTKGLCDGPPTSKDTYSTCGESGANTSHTLLNNPADIAVDPNPDPVTGEVGSVYIADGYGNHRIVVFDAKGGYLRQFGTAGSGPGQFVATGGGHPHCVLLGNDRLVYACDRGQNRIHVFDRTGTLQKTIPIDPPSQLKATSRATDMAFSRDEQQRYMYVTDLGSNMIWIVDRSLGTVVGSIGQSGHNVGQFIWPHTLAIDSKGNLYVSETVNGRRNQKFVRTGN